MQRRLPEWRRVRKIIGSFTPEKQQEKNLYSWRLWERAKGLFTKNDRSHIWECSNRLALSMETTWKVLRKNWKWKVFRSHKVEVLSPANKLDRKSACNLSRVVVWKSDMDRQKMVCAKDHIRIRNDRYWHKHISMKFLNARKRTAKELCHVDGLCIPGAWFDGSVNTDVYVGKVLNGT